MCIAGKIFVSYAVLIAVYPLKCWTYSNPKYAFPICSSSYAFEIVVGDTVASEHDQCGFNFDGSHPEFSYVPLSLDGVLYPYVDLVVPDNNELKTFGFVVFFKPSSVAGLHAIFHYKYFGSLSEVTEVRLYIDNGIVTINVVGGPGGTDTATLDMSVAVGAGYWTYVELVKDYPTGQLKMAMKTDTPSVPSTTVYSTTGNFPSDNRLEVPGTIRVGNFHGGGNSGFLGEITCVMLYDSDDLADGVNDYSSVVAECQQPWGKSPSGLPSSPSTGCTSTTSLQITNQPLQTTTTQMLTTSDTCMRTATAPEVMLFRKLPHTNLVDVDTIETTPVNSPMKCASICSLTNCCTAFVYNVINGSLKSCSLFRSYHPSYVISDPDSQLYVQSD